jgi:hypothetical protein
MLLIKTHPGGQGSPPYIWLLLITLAKNLSPRTGFLCYSMKTTCHISLKIFQNSFRRNLFASWMSYMSLLSIPSFKVDATRKNISKRRMGQFNNRKRIDKVSYCRLVETFVTKIVFCACVWKINTTPICKPARSLILTQYCGQYVWNILLCVKSIIMGNNF